MSKYKIPGTPAIHYLRKNDAEFKAHFYDYVKSGAKLAAIKLGADLHLMIKTLVKEDDDKNPFIVLMNGDKDVSEKQMSKKIGAKSVSICSVKNAQKHTGYKVGGISPFGIRKDMPVYIEESILALSTLFINAGRRGFLVEISPRELIRLLKPIPVNVAKK